MSDKAPPHDCWTPGRIAMHLGRGLLVPHDWRERLQAAGYLLPPAPEPDTLTLFDTLKGE